MRILEQQNPLPIDDDKKNISVELSREVLDFLSHGKNLMEDNNILSWLQSWFYENCDGDWEHNTNVKIVNLDNPGWSIFINLEGTSLEDKKFDQFKDYRNENDWVYCTVESKMLKED